MSLSGEHRLDFVAERGAPGNTIKSSLSLDCGEQRNAPSLSFF
jgi:hypothetical protein